MDHPPVAVLVLKNTGYIFGMDGFGGILNFGKMKGIGGKCHITGHPDDRINEFDMIGLYGRRLFHQKTVEADPPEQVAPGFGLKTGDLLAHPVKVGIDIGFLNGVKQRHQGGFNAADLARI